MKNAFSGKELAAIIKTENKRFSSLRMQMADNHPFWGHLAMQFKIVASTEMEGIASTDCQNHIWFNPLLTMHIPIQQLGFVLCHEICHTVFATLERQSGRNQHRWNCATDYAINQVIAGIIKPGFWEKERLYHVPNVEIPDFGKVTPLLNPEFECMTAESIYERLADRRLPEEVSISVSLPIPANSNSSGRTITTSGTTFEKGAIDIHLPVSISENKREAMIERIVDAVHIWKKTNNKGNCPLSQLRNILPADKSETPWQEILQLFACNALSRDEFSYTHPNKHYIEEGFIVPGIRSAKTDSIVIALDTSGSMQPEQLSKAFAEIRTIAEHGTVTLIIADCEVKKVIEDPDLETFLDAHNAPGGGGTSHKPVFAYIEKEQLQPDLFIGITDLYSDFPKEEPPFPVLWLTPEEHASAPWGKILQVDGNLIDCEDDCDEFDEDELFPF
jgi:predicted metal-dependent peptidase